ncbi:MAG: response regulator [Burkholderiaceae bacterium]
MTNNELTDDGSTTTILVCDDDRLVLLSVTSALRKAGFKVVEADNGDDAILLARQYRPSLAVLDIRMDGKSGLDVAVYLRDYVGTPFMFLSAFANEETIRQAKQLGAVEYLQKPVDSDRLVEVVRAAVGLVAPPDGLVPSSMVDTGNTGAPNHWIAAGVLMEREGLDLASALRRLQSEAARMGLPVPEVARRIVDSVPTRVDR